MFGLFSLFGPPREIKALDAALHAAGVHPRAVPPAVKLTALRLLKAAPAAGAEPALADAARLLAYCMLGPQEFTSSNGAAQAGRVHDRLEAAIAAGDGLDARLILLAVHSGVIAPEVAERFDIEAE